MFQTGKEAWKGRFFSGKNLEESKEQGLERVKCYHFQVKNLQESKEQGLCSTGKKAWKGSSLFPFQLKMSRRAKNRACVQQVRERKPRSKESNGGVLSNGLPKESTINKVKAC
ncbi:hypothetical protein TNCT_420971 [Trichonephila clavata]|uniref:Uncharacterized protein n=1 Tax=Trichonephila clavata TaxID=2740835 RepID=A0A8X6HHN0_TRICU|nr:hypothetical protein TNCT_420971 [Trichonephila clavata]